jgi:hypothetical protein
MICITGAEASLKSTGQVVRKDKLDMLGQKPCPQAGCFLSQRNLISFLKTLTDWKGTFQIIVMNFFTKSHPLMRLSLSINTFIVTPTLIFDRLTGDLCVQGTHKSDTPSQFILLHKGI